MLLTAAIYRWIPNWVSAWRPGAQYWLTRTAAYAIGAVVFIALIGELFAGLGERQHTRSALEYKTGRDQSGAFAHLVAPVRTVATVFDPRIPAPGGQQIISRPIISLSQYLDNVPKHSAKRWNVILIIVESLGANQLQMYGGTREVMPAVEALARGGRVFSNSYTQASHTDYATLVPLSSHYPLRAPNLHVYAKDPTYPRTLIYDVLKPLGYRTAIFSSSNEYWSGMINYLQTGNVERFVHAENFTGPTYVAEGDSSFAEWVKTTKHAGSVDDRFTVADAMRWIDGLSDEPFFMYLNLQNSHAPYVIPKDFARRFSPEKLDFTIRVGHIPKEKISVAKDVYADSLAYVDAQLSRLFTHLQNKGLWDRTVVVVTGDHGQAFYEHGFAAHANAIYNEVMAVPLIIRAPGLKPGIDNRPAQHVDILPSVLDLLGLPPHPSSQGVTLFDPQPNPNRSIYLVAQTTLAHQYGMVRSRFKLIYDANSRQYFLYDLAADPGEMNEIGATNPEILKEMASRLQTWRKLQIDYYADRVLHSREYPPLLAD